MDIFSLFSLACGVAFVLYGMQTMSSGLEKAAGGKFEKILEKVTNNPIKGLFFGIIVTAVMQSSSATTVMVVGFVNTGLMSLYQAVGVIMGANIGTTITSWIFSLAGLETDNIFLKLLKPSSFAPIFAVIGIIILLGTKNGKKRNLGAIFLGFAILMEGMSMMTNAVEPLADIPEFRNILIAMSNPIFGVLTGAILTAIIQSSAASIGILQALTVTGAITYGNAIPIIFGQNIGTCATALLSCIGATKNAKRAALAHLYFNLIGTIIFLAGFYGLNAVLDFAFVESPLSTAHIAVIHSAFNIGSTILLFPFSKLLAKLAMASIKDSKTEEQVPVLDERFLNTPSFAVEQCRQETGKMAKIVEKTILGAVAQVRNYDAKTINDLRASEDIIDKYEDVLGSYLVKLSAHELNYIDSREISKILHVIGDLERIGDHADNMLEVVEEMHDKNVSFSPDGMRDLDKMLNAVEEIITITIRSLVEEDTQLANSVEPLEQVIDHIRAEMKQRHRNRLQEGGCTIELGFMYADILSDCERISDHCSNVAVCVIQLHDETFDTHDYLNSVKNDSNGFFKSEYERFLAKYDLN